MATAKAVYQDDNHQPTAGRKREFLAFIKSLRSFRGDLSSITAPPFLLSPTSTTELATYWAEQPSLFVAPALEQDPKKRALLVLEWYIASLQQNYGKRDGRKKKPLNSFLGEVFLGHFHDELRSVEVVAEQVSHHPPVTAFHLWNEAHGVHLHGYNRQKTFFSGTIRFEAIGYVMLHLDKYDEDYLITLPRMHLEGLFPPPPYPELEGTTYIQSSSGFTAEIEFSGKGWLRGKKNSFCASLYPEGRPGDVLYTSEGQWQFGSFTIRDAQSREVMQLFDTTSTKLAPLIVPPIEKQGPLESRRAWNKVILAIEKGDMSTVTAEKSRIEEEQRAMRKTEKIEGKVWPRRYFSQVESWPKLEELVAKVGHKIDVEATSGMWKWDEEKYLFAKSSA